jgi:hypothetical protein
VFWKSVKKIRWAAFGHNRCTGLDPFNGDPQAARNRVTSWVIQNLYQALQNGTGLHQRHIVEEMLEEINI